MAHNRDKELMANSVLVLTIGRDSTEKPNLVLLYDGTGCWCANLVFVALGPLAVHDMDLDRVKSDIVFISSDGEFAWLIRMCSDCFLC